MGAQTAVSSTKAEDGGLLVAWQEMRPAISCGLCACILF